MNIFEQNWNFLLYFSCITQYWRYWKFQMWSILTLVSRESKIITVDWRENNNFWLFSFNRFRPQTMSPNKSPIQSNVVRTLCNIIITRTNIFLCCRVFHSIDNLIFLLPLRTWKERCNYFIISCWLSDSSLL